MFFLALSFAAISSLISMIELTTRTLIDFGINRKRAVIIVAVCGFILGIPSAMSSDVFLNQDWVWGVGLLISGAFISFSVIRFGVNKFRTELINGVGSEIKIGKWYNFVIAFLIPVQVIVLVSWWLISSVSWDSHWWNPFHSENAGTCLFQWAIVIGTFLFFNKQIVKNTLDK